MAERINKIYDIFTQSLSKPPVFLDLNALNYKLFLPHVIVPRKDTDIANRINPEEQAPEEQAPKESEKVAK